MAKRNVVGAKGARLLRKVAKHILEEPKRLNMMRFINRKGDGWPIYGEYPECGTMGCIAGWAVALSTDELVKYNDIQDRAAKLLGLNPAQQNVLFFYGKWPIEFQKRLLRTEIQTLPYAKVTADRIEHFIRTGE